MEKNGDSRLFQDDIKIIDNIDPEKPNKITMDINGKNVTVNDIDYLLSKIAYEKIKDKDPDYYYMLMSGPSKSFCNSMMGGWTYETFYRVTSVATKIYLYKINKNKLNYDEFNNLLLVNRKSFKWFLLNEIYLT